MAAVLFLPVDDCIGKTGIGKILQGGRPGGRLI